MGQHIKGILVIIAGNYTLSFFAQHPISQLINQRLHSITA